MLRNRLAPAETRRALRVRVTDADGRANAEVAVADPDLVETAIALRPTLTAEQRKKLFPPDFDWLSKNDAAQLEWWNKEFV